MYFSFSRTDTNLCQLILPDSFILITQFKYKFTHQRIVPVVVTTFGTVLKSRIFSGDYPENLFYSSTVFIMIVTLVNDDNREGLVLNNLV